MDKEYVAILITGEQYTEENWKSVTRTFKCSEETTLAEIELWYRKHIPRGEMNIQISQIEKPNNNG